MTGILRQQSKIFAENAPIRLVTAFRTAGDNPTQSKTPDVIQNETYSVGWINADNTGNLIPYAEDMNGVLYTLSYNTSYLFEKGMPEYSPEQIYYENSFCQYGGYLYRCKVDETLNIVPTNTNYWDKIETDAYSATNIGTGEGFYASMSGTQFRFKTLIAADDSVVIDSGDDYVSIRAVAPIPSITASSPLSYNNGALSIQAADSSQDGYLTAADWASFNGKLTSSIFSADNSWSGQNTFTSTLTLQGVLDIGKYSTLAADRYAIIRGYSSEYAGGLANWAYLGYFDSCFTLAPTADNTANYTLGTSNYRWGKIYGAEVNATSLTLNGTTYSSIPAAANNGSYAIKMNNTTKGTVYANGTGTNTIDLGTVITALPGTRNIKINSSSKVTVYATGSGDVDLGSYLPLSGGTMTGNIMPNASGSKYLGAANAKWEVHASHVYCPSYNLDNCQIYHIGTDTSSVQIGWLNGANAVALYMKSGAVYPYSNQGLTLGTSSNRWGTIYGIGAVNTSDRRKKHNIIELENALEKLNTVEVKSYTMDGVDYGVNFGMIAQDEVERNPELVFVPDNYSEEEGGGELGFVSNNVLFLAVKAIQELSAEVEILKQQLREIRNED